MLFNYIIKWSHKYYGMNSKMVQNICTKMFEWVELSGTDNTNLYLWYTWFREAKIYDSNINMSVKISRKGWQHLLPWMVYITKIENHWSGNIELQLYNDDINDYFGLTSSSYVTLARYDVVYMTFVANADNTFDLIDLKKWWIPN